MNIVFFGTADFAVPALKILLDQGINVSAVVTAVDKPGGRQGIQQSPVKLFAQAQGLQVLQPNNLKDPEFINTLRQFKADLQIVVAFRMMPEVVWSMPPFGTMNLHGSLLPKYRGAAPINWAIINGETETGVTTFLLKHEIDTGDLLFQEKTPIGPDETAGEVYERLMHLGATVLLKSVRALESGNYQLLPQQESEVRHAPKIHTATCEINWNQPSAVIHNFVRGLSPYPGAWTMLDDKTLKILRTAKIEAGDSPRKAGQFINDGNKVLKVSTMDGYLEVLELQLQGKRRMTAQEFLNGRHI